MESKKFSKVKIKKYKYNKKPKGEFKIKGIIENYTIISSTAYDTTFIYLISFISIFSSNYSLTFF